MPCGGRARSNDAICACMRDLWRIGYVAVDRERMPETRKRVETKKRGEINGLLPHLPGVRGQFGSLRKMRLSNNKKSYKQGGERKC